MNFAEIDMTVASNMIFESICKRYVKDESLVIVMSHFGVFSQDLINSLAEGAEEILISANEKKPMIRRVFSVLIEGLQNIKIHGEADDEGIKRGILVFAKGEDGLYKISFGNLILNKLKDSMETRLNELNSLSEEELKQRYMAVLSNGILSNKGGAGLGFITMKMKAKSKLNFNFHPVSDEYAMFTFELVVKRLD